MARGRRKWRWKAALHYGACSCAAANANDEVSDDEEVALSGKAPAASPHRHDSVNENDRRDGVSYNADDTNAVYVRMLADAKVADVVREENDGVMSPLSALLPSHDEQLLLDKLLSGTSRVCTPPRRPYSPRQRRRRAQSVVPLSRDSAHMLDHSYQCASQLLQSRISTWECNVFSIDRISNGNSLVCISLQLFHYHNLISSFCLDNLRLRRFLLEAQDGYHRTNPFHHAVHAADVTQAMHCFLLQDPLVRHLTDLEKMVALLAAITHDIDHPGVNQAFLIATSDPLATLYKNISVLENHHWRFAVSLLQATGVFAHLPTVQWQALVSQLRSLILATDITCQQHYLATFKNHLDVGDLKLADSEQDRHFVLQMALKCADISNPCRPWEISRKWSEYVCDEFFRQGDRERMLHLPVTAICDRHGTSTAQIQIGFMKYVVSPLYAQWYRFVPSRLTAVMLHNVTTNASCWEAIVAECERHQAEEVEETAGAEEEEAEGEDGERPEQVPGTAIQEVVTSVVEGSLEDVEAANSQMSHDTLNVSNASCQITEPNSSTSEVTSSTHEVHERPLSGGSNRSGQGRGQPSGTHLLHAPLINGRRLSLPPPRMPSSTSSSSSSKRLTPDSCNRLRNRRHTVANGNDNDVRFDAMVDRLTALAECIASDEAHGIATLAGDGRRTPTIHPRLPSIGDERLQSFTQESDRQSSAHGLSMSADSQERLAAKRMSNRAGTEGSNSRRYSDMKLGGQANRLYPAALLAGGKHLKHQSSLPSFSPTLARRRPTDATVTTTWPAPCDSNDNVFHVSWTGQAMNSVLAKDSLANGPS